MDRKIISHDFVQLRIVLNQHTVLSFHQTFVDQMVFLISWRMLSKWSFAMTCSFYSIFCSQKFPLLGLTICRSVYIFVAIHVPSFPLSISALSEIFACMHWVCRCVLPTWKLWRTLPLNIKILFVLLRKPLSRTRYDILNCTRNAYSNRVVWLLLFCYYTQVFY